MMHSMNPPWWCDINIHGTRYGESTTLLPGVMVALRKGLQILLLLIPPRALAQVSDRGWLDSWSNVRPACLRVSYGHRTGSAYVWSTRTSRYRRIPDWCVCTLELVYHVFMGAYVQFGVEDGAVDGPMRGPACVDISMGMTLVNLITMSYRTLCRKFWCGYPFTPQHGTPRPQRPHNRLLVELALHDHHCWHVASHIPAFAE